MTLTPATPVTVWKHAVTTVRSPDGKVVEVRAPGMTLGVVDDVGGKPQKLALEDGHLMVMYTDGLIEARDAGPG